MLQLSSKYNLYMRMVHLIKKKKQKTVKTSFNKNVFSSDVNMNLKVFPPHCEYVRAECERGGPMSENKVCLGMWTWSRRNGTETKLDEAKSLKSGHS